MGFRRITTHAISKPGRFWGEMLFSKFLFTDKDHRRVLWCFILIRIGVNLPRKSSFVTLTKLLFTRVEESINDIKDQELQKEVSDLFHIFGHSYLYSLKDTYPSYSEYRSGTRRHREYASTIILGYNKAGTLADKIQLQSRTLDKVEAMSEDWFVGRYLYDKWRKIASISGLQYMSSDSNETLAGERKFSKFSRGLKHLSGMIASFYEGDVLQAIAEQRAAEGYKGSFRGTIFEVEFIFFSFLLLSQGNSSGKVNKKLRSLALKLAYFQKLNPYSFSFFATMATGEIHRIQGSYEKALYFFERAKKHGNYFESFEFCGLASEMQAKLWILEGNRELGKKLLNDSIDFYKDGGFISRARFLADGNASIIESSIKDKNKRSDTQIVSLNDYAFRLMKLNREEDILDAYGDMIEKVHTTIGGKCFYRRGNDENWLTIFEWTGKGGQRVVPVYVSDKTQLGYIENIASGKRIDDLSIAGHLLYENDGSAIVTVFEVLAKEFKGNNHDSNNFLSLLSGITGSRLGSLFREFKLTKDLAFQTGRFKMYREVTLINSLELEQFLNDSTRQLAKSKNLLNQGQYIRAGSYLKIRTRIQAMYLESKNLGLEALQGVCEATIASCEVASDVGGDREIADISNYLKECQGILDLYLDVTKELKGVQSEVKAETIGDLIKKLAQTDLDDISPDENVHREIIGKAKSIADFDLEDIIAELKEKIDTEALKLNKRSPNIRVHNGSFRFDSSLVNVYVTVLWELIKNSMMYGIESPSKRFESHKSVKGLIEINVEQDGIEFWDDGVGLDIRWLQSKGEELGLLSQGAQHNLEDIANLIFNPRVSKGESDNKNEGLSYVRAILAKAGAEIVVKLLNQSSRAEDHIAFVYYISLPKKSNESVA